MADLTFYEQLALAGVQAILPVGILLLGGKSLLDAYDVRRKKSEARVELNRFTRERQYDSLRDLQKLFSDFMKLYRDMSSPALDMSNAELCKTLEDRCSRAESAIDGIILRITSEFAQGDDGSLAAKLAIFRQSVQTWRQAVRQGKPVRFFSSSQPDYVLFKRSFSQVTTYLLQELYGRLDPPEISSTRSEKLLLEVFDNTWEEEYDKQREALVGRSA